MKKTVLALMCLAALVGCKKAEKTATASEVEEAAMEEVFSGDNKTPEAIDYYGKEMGGLTFEGLSNEIAGENVYIYGANRALTIVRQYTAEELSEEETKAIIEKVYNFVKSKADNGICVWGWYEKNTKEEALAEKTLDEVIAAGKKNYDMYSWDYAVDGHLFTISVDIEGNKSTVQAVNGLQKSQDEIWNDLEEAMEDEEFQEKVKDALQN